MFMALAILAIYVIVVWLVFFRFKLRRFTFGWGIFSSFFIIHVLLIVVVGLRFVTPTSKNAKIIQHTIQLTPRLPDPTLVTEVLVEPNVPVKKGQVLFKFDTRLYQDKVNSVKAQLAGAEQRVPELKADVDAAIASVAKAKGQRAAQKGALAVATASVGEARAQQMMAKSKMNAAGSQVVEAKAKLQLMNEKSQIAESVRKDDQGAISKLRLDVARQEVAETEASVKVAEANEQVARVNYEVQALAGVQVALANEQMALAVYEEEAVATIQVAQAHEQKARLAYAAQIDGVNPTVANLRASLAEAEYYLDQCTMVAPEDGYVINLQVRPGMVAGHIRAGAIASFVVDANRYLLATYFQENLKFVKQGQYVEVAFDLYPGQIFKGKVTSIWQGSGQGQMLPSGNLPTFNPVSPEAPQGQFAVQIEMDDEDQSKFPIGAQGAAAIYTSTQGPFPTLRRIGIRAHSWLNWLYPL
ncbi:EmrA/EmrK family multidrug efflux transporter periplasmic adaptor subunit [soil metagenome]